MVIKDSFEPRIVGSETEYNPVFVKDSGDETGLCGRDLDLPDGLESINGFATNGARIYVDYHNLPEYATPECASFADLVHSEIAGELIVVNALYRALGQGGVTRAVLHKRTATDAFYEKDSQSGEMSRDGNNYSGQSRIVSWGYHENYGMDRENFVSGLTELLVKSHLLTRGVLVGSGYLRPTQESPTRILPSQKMMDVSAETAYGTTSNKPIFNTRDESHASSGLTARLHVVSGDSNIFPWSTWMKIGSTSLILRLAETGQGKTLRDKLPNDIMATLRRYQQFGAEAIVCLSDGSEENIIDVQERLAEACSKLSNDFELPREEQAVLLEWRQAIDDYKNEPDKLVDRTEWIARRCWLEAVYDKISGGDIGKVTKQLNTADRMWDKLIPYPNLDRDVDVRKIGRAVCLRPRASFPGYTPLRARELVQRPPTGTRAEERAKLIAKRIYSGSDPCRVDWEIVGDTELPDARGDNLDYMYG